ncbi:virulence factor [Caldimicrobium thiodismutans]|uniref:Probable lipid II flippase MurJ n=1 Tax=Caldimicrobium thiodismutans TaxID=1653476 RepID=A0A0U5AXP8_9BACT|nr:murein biosynthesis integral membrane protein MurJ [Caldimicrobium thiodismutans]BAU23422.1 virulence factor [Caldimicrobium thiodismutans]
MSSIEKVTKGATSVTVAVFISRILGLLREQVLAYFFGAGKAMDAYVVGYRIPNLLRDLFAEGALAGAFVKVFTATTEKEGLERAFKKASILISNFLLILLIIVLIGFFLAPIIVSVIAPAFKTDSSKFALTVSLTRVMMPFLLFISLSAIFAGLLNSIGIFFLPALSSGFFNLSSILIGVFGYYLLLSYGYEPIFAMAFGVTLGGLLQALMQYPLLKKKGFTFRFKVDFTLPEFYEILRLIFPVIIGFSAVQINIFINTFFATSCGEGAVSWYSYAFRIMYVPLGLFGVGLSQALLPELTRNITQGNFSLARETYGRALIVSLSLSLPSALGLFLLSEEIVKILFERGAFKPEDTLWTSEILKIFSLALPFYGLSKATVPLFYALNRTGVPAAGSFLAVFINLLIILFTIKIFGIKGVALGTTGGLFAQCLFLLFLSFRYLGFPEKEFFLRSLLTFFISLIALSGVILFSKSFLFSPGLRLIFAIPLGAFVFIIICKFLGPKETYIFYKKLLRK